MSRRLLFIWHSRIFVKNISRWFLGLFSNFISINRLFFTTTTGQHWGMNFIHWHTACASHVHVFPSIDILNHCSITAFCPVSSGSLKENGTFKRFNYYCARAVIHHHAATLLLINDVSLSRLVCISKTEAIKLVLVSFVCSLKVHS